MLRTILLLSLLSTSCSAIKGLTGSGGKPSGKGWADVMSEAPTYDVPNVIEVKQPVCSGMGYTKLAVEEGARFHVVISPSASCASVSVMNGQGQAANTDGNQLEVCSDKGPQTLVSTGQAGGTIIGTGELYGCTGITIALDVKPGAPAAGAAGASAPPGPGAPPAVDPNEPTEPPTM